MTTLDDDTTHQKPTTDELWARSGQPPFKLDEKVRKQIDKCNQLARKKKWLDFVEATQKLFDAVIGVEIVDDVPKSRQSSRVHDFVNYTTLLNPESPEDSLEFLFGGHGTLLFMAIDPLHTAFRMWKYVPSLRGRIRMAADIAQQFPKSAARLAKLAALNVTDVSDLSPVAIYEALRISLPHDDAGPEAAAILEHFATFAPESELPLHARVLDLLPQLRDEDQQTTREYRGAVAGRVCDFYARETGNPTMAEPAISRYTTAKKEQLENLYAVVQRAEKIRSGASGEHAAALLIRSLIMQRPSDPFLPVLIKSASRNHDNSWTMEGVELYQSLQRVPFEIVKAAKAGKVMRAMDLIGVLAQTNRMDLSQSEAANTIGPVLEAVAEGLGKFSDDEFVRIRQVVHALGDKRVPYAEQRNQLVAMFDDVRTLVLTRDSFA